MLKMIRKFLGLFRKKKVVKELPVIETPVINKKVIKVTSGGKHVWIETKHGVVRKPKSSIK